jgi:hypothetical protein
MKLYAILFALVAIVVGPGMPAAADTLENEAAYRELLARADPSQIVEHEGRRYVRAPQGVAGLPGGYDGGYERRMLNLPNGTEVEVIDPTRPLKITRREKDPAAVGKPSDRGPKIEAALKKLGLGLSGKDLDAGAVVRVRATDVANGKERPNSSRTTVWVDLSKPDQIRRSFETLKQATEKRLQVAGPAGGSRMASYSQGSVWTCWIEYYANPRDGKNRGQHMSLNSVSGDVDYQASYVESHCIKNDAYVHVRHERYDSLSHRELYAQSSDPDYYSRARNDLFASRTDALTLLAKPECENWMKAITTAIDEIDGVTRPPDPPGPVVAGRPVSPIIAPPGQPTTRPSADAQKPSAASPCPIRQAILEQLVTKEKSIQEACTETERELLKNTILGIDLAKEYKVNGCGLGAEKPICATIATDIAKNHTEKTRLEKLNRDTCNDMTKTQQRLSAVRRNFVKDCESEQINQAGSEKIKEILDLFGITERDLQLLPPRVRQELIEQPFQ